MYRPTTKNEWWLCGLLLTQGIVTIALELYILVQWQSWVTPKIIQVVVSYLIPIALAILIFACVYEFILTLDAIHNKNNILLFAIYISNICTFAYSVMQYRLVESTTASLFKERYSSPTLIDTTRNVWPLIKPAMITMCIITGLGTLVMSPCVYFLHREYSWTIYKCVHGSRRTRTRYLFYEIFLVLMKLNFYFLIGFILQYNLIYVHFTGLEYILTMCLIPAAFICMLLGIYFVHNERTWGVIGVIICCLGLLVYLISRIIILCGDVILGKDMMLLFAFVSLILTAATVVCAIVCITNFDQGFKVINKSKNNVARDSYFLQTGALPSSHPSLRPPSRLTLD